MARRNGTSLSVLPVKGTMATGLEGSGASAPRGAGLSIPTFAKRPQRDYQGSSYPSGGKAFPCNAKAFSKCVNC